VRPSGDASPAPRVRRARAGELPAVLALRFAVFVEEQGVPEDLEHDAEDATAVHLVLEEDGAVIGTCRLLGDGARVRLGRMAVARARRGEGLGALLLDHAHAAARAAGAREVELHAQVAVRGFYERAGYAAEGGVFEEAGIAHVTMRRALSPPRA
jgi:predicted GNAT family N-acyltransferase